MAKDVFALHLGSGGRTAIRAVFVISVTMLASAAICAVWGAIRPRPRLVMDEQGLRAFSFSMLAAPTIEIQGKVMSTLFDMLEHERAGNDVKARIAVLAGVMFIVGLAGVGVLAVVLGLSGTG